MAPKKSARGYKKAEMKTQTANKNGKKAESSGGSSSFTLLMVVALLGVWMSVAVVYFDLVDYQGVMAKAKDFHINLSEAIQGKLAAYDSDGDGDFDVEDAKVLLGLTLAGGQGEESLEDGLVEEGSDWFNGFFTFLYGLLSPFEPMEDGEGAADEEEDEEGAATGATAKTDRGQGQKIVIVGLHNQ